MPYEGEFASYRPLQRIVETERVRTLLGRARVYQPSASTSAIHPLSAPVATGELPPLVVAIDGSAAEVPVKNGYPGARVGYCTVASVLLNLREVERLDRVRPIEPQAFRKTERPATIDAALPGTNIVIRTHTSARDSFREALYETFHDVIVDEEDRVRLLETYEALLAHKPLTRPPICPYEREGCQEHFNPSPGASSCVCSKRLPIYSTDALRIHERFHEAGSNGEAYGEVIQVWERILMVHLLRCFERKHWIDDLPQLAFFVDGPLAIFGHPAWLSAAISAELKRLHRVVFDRTGKPLVIVGIEKTGAFVSHFDDIDKTETGEPRFPPRTFLFPTDQYIKEHIIFSLSTKRYGEDTYFGRKILYKTASGARIVANIPYLTDAQDTLATSDTSLYPQLGPVCSLLDKLVSCRFPNSISPIVSAHAHAAIPLELGAKVLQQLAHALVRKT